MTDVHSRADKIEIEVHDDLAALERRWRALERDGLSTPFQSWEWQAALRRAYGGQKRTRFFALTAVDRATGADLVILPLVQTRRGLNRSLAMADLGFADYNAPLFARDVADGVLPFEMFWTRLLQKLPPASFLHLQKVPALIEGRPNPMAGLPGFRNETYSAWSMTLPQGQLGDDAYFSTGKARRKLRSFRRRIEEPGTASDLVPETAHGRWELLEWLLKMQETRFQRIGRKRSLPLHALQEFHHAVIHSTPVSFTPDVRALTLDGTIIAALYGIKTRNCYHQLMCAMDEEQARLKPGLTLMWRTIETMHHAGCREYDFSIGDQGYKTDFNTARLPILEFMKPLSITSIPAAGWYAAQPSLVAAKRNLAAQQSPLLRPIAKLLGG